MLGDPGDIGYPDRLRVTRAGTAPGTQDPDTGVWTPGMVPTATLYDGPALVQDYQAVIRRDETGRPAELADAKAFLPPDAAAVMPQLRTGLPAVVTWADGSVTEAQVASARRLDRVVLLSMVGVM